MRKSRDSLDTILHEREEGVGAESPVGDLSRDGIRAESDFNFKELSAWSDPQNKPCYGFKIALVSASSKTQATKVVAFDHAGSGMPVGERDGVPEGCSFVDEQQLDVATRHQNSSKKEESESDSVNYQGENNSATLEDGTEAIDTQGAPLFDEKDPQHIAQQATDPVSKVADNEVCSATETGLTNQQLVAGDKENLTTVYGRDSHTCQAVTHVSACMTESLEQISSRDTANKNELELLVEDSTNKTTDNYETCNDSLEAETMAGETPTDLQGEVSIVPLADGTADEEATRTIIGTAEPDSMEEAAKQQVVNENIAEGSSELLEQESSIPNRRMTVEEGHKSEILPNSDVESSSHLTEDCSIATPSC